MSNTETNQRCSKCESKNAVVVLLDKLYCSVCALKKIGIYK